MFFDRSFWTSSNAPMERNPSVVRHVATTTGSANVVNAIAVTHPAGTNASPPSVGVVDFAPVRCPARSFLAHGLVRLLFREVRTQRARRDGGDDEGDAEPLQRRAQERGAYERRRRVARAALDDAPSPAQRRGRVEPHREGEGHDAEERAAAAGERRPAAARRPPR